MILYKTHRFKFQRGRKVLLPCRMCGTGVQSKIQLCCGCGRERKKESVKVNIMYMRLSQMKLPVCAVGMCNAILGNDLNLFLIQIKEGSY